MIVLSQQDGFVFYQTPGSKEILFLSGSWKKIDLQTNQIFKGFIISNSDKTATYFLEGKGKVISSNYKFQSNNTSPHNKTLDRSNYLIKSQLYMGY